MEKNSYVGLVITHFIHILLHCACKYVIIVMCPIYDTFEG